MSVHVYAANILRVVDGDTLDVRVDLGFYMTTVQRMRLIGINAPETRGAEGKLGKVCRAYVESLLPVFKADTTIRTFKADGFGRWLADVHCEQIGLLSDHLVVTGFAVPWDCLLYTSDAADE